MHHTSSPFARRTTAARRALLQQRAASMRSLPTRGEALLWQQLRSSKLGVTFRRQFPIGNCIADFAAPAVRLVVEVDGGWHRGRARLDARRDRALARLGWRVLRLEEELVVQRVQEAVARVRAALG